MRNDPVIQIPSYILFLASQYIQCFSIDIPAFVVDVVVSELIAAVRSLAFPIF